MIYFYVFKSILSGLLLGLAMIYGGTAMLTDEHPAKTDMFLTALFFLLLSDAVAP